MMEETKGFRAAKYAAWILIACLIAGTFVGFTARAAVSFTGSVITTDSAGTPKDTFFRGEPVYFNVELNYQGTPVAEGIHVELVRSLDGQILDTMDEVTDDPVVGWYNSSQSTPTDYLPNNAWIPGDLAVYNVVVYETWSWTQVGFATITVLNTGLWIEPESMIAHYPGEEVTISLVTTHTTEVFYVQVINQTGATMVNWTAQTAPDGHWSTVWVIPVDFPDGAFQLMVRDAATHDIWESQFLLVMEYIVVTSVDRSSFLAGESATVTYSILSIGTLEIQDSLDLTYSARWLNSTGAEMWENGTLAGGSGTHVFNIPTDIALYQDVIITYWINETPGVRTAETDTWLYLGLLEASISVDGDYYIPGDSVVVSVEAEVGWSVLPGANVDIVVTRDGSAVAEYGASGLVTDFNGDAAHSFLIASNESQGTLVVSATISKAGQSVTRMTTIEVVWYGAINIEMDKDLYNMGDTVTVYVQVLWNNVVVTGQTVTYIAQIGTGMLIIGNTTSDSFSFDLPDDYYGAFWVQVVVNLDGYVTADMAVAQVAAADVVVSAVRENYDALDVLEFNYVVVSLAPGAELVYEIADSMGFHVTGGFLPYGESGTIQFTVPAFPSDSYTCIVTMDTHAGLVVSGYDTATLNNAYELMVQIHPSSHLLGSFVPGETLVMEYTILAHGLPTLAAYEIVIYASWNEEWSVLVTDVHGNLSVLIPEDASNGWSSIEAQLLDPTSGGWLAGAGAMISIDAAADEWDLVIQGLQQDVADLSRQISDQGNMTMATLEGVWDQVNSTRAEVETLMDNLAATLAAVNVSSDNIELLMADLEAMDAQLDALQTELAALQEDMNIVEDDIGARPTGQSVAMYLAVAVVVLIAAAFAITFIMKRKA